MILEEKPGMDLTYAYANARIKAMSVKLLSQEQLRQLISVRTLNEVIELLEESDYKDSFVDASVKYSGFELVLKALNLDFVRTMQKVMKIVPPVARPAMEALLRKWEVQSIQYVLTAKALDEPIADSELIFLDPHRRRFLEQFVQAKDFSSALHALASTEYGRIIAAAKPEYERTKKDYRVFLGAFDHYYYKLLAAELEKQKDFNVRSLLRSEIETHNIMIVLRLKLLPASLKEGQLAPADVIDSFLIPGGSYSFVRELARAPDLDTAMKKVADKYKIGDAVEKAKKLKSLAPVEIALERLFTEKTMLTTRRAVLSFGTVMGFVYLKQREIRSIRALAFATQLGLGEEVKEIVFKTGALTAAQHK